MNSKVNISFEHIIEVIGTFNQEGLGLLKWWENQ